MWLGIDAASWAQLWSGTFGSFIAAVLGGLVALMVVRLTNGQNERQAERSRQIAAVADLVGGLDNVLVDFGAARTGDLHPPFVVLQSAWVRLKMSGQDAAALAEALKDVPSFVSHLTSGFPPADRGNAKSSEYLLRLRAAVASISENLPDWTHGDAQAREKILREVTDSAQKLKQELRRLESEQY
jgi:hypothetical protein